MTKGLSQEQIKYVQSFLSELEYKLKPVGQFTNEEFMYNLTRGEHAYYVFHLLDTVGGRGMTGAVSSDRYFGETVTITYCSVLPSDAPVDVMLKLRKIAADEGVGISPIESPDPVLQPLMTLGFEDVPMFPENKPRLTIDDFIEMVQKTKRAGIKVMEVEKEFPQYTSFYRKSSAAASATDL